MILKAQDLQHGDRFEHDGVLYEARSEPDRPGDGHCTLPVRRLQETMLALPEGKRLNVEEAHPFRRGMRVAHRNPYEPHRLLHGLRGTIQAVKSARIIVLWDRTSVMGARGDTPERRTFEYDPAELDFAPEEGPLRHGEYRL